MAREASNDVETTTQVLVSAPRGAPALDWQCALLDWSCREHLGPHVLHRLTDEHPRLARDYVPANKPHAVRRFLERNAKATRGRVMVCDPDIVFRAAWTRYPGPGEMHADEFAPGAPATGPFSPIELQRMVERLALDLDPRSFVQAHTGVMVFWGGDLLPIAARAEDLTERLHRLRPDWQNEMYAWYLAIAERRVAVRLHRIAAPNDWSVAQSEFAAIHYCQPISMDGVEVWRKGDADAWRQLLALDPARVDRPGDTELIRLSALAATSGVGGTKR
jgi:hypothetical protein